MQIKNSVVVITGGGQGLGKEMALEMAQKGAHLALIDLNEEKLKIACAECAEFGAKAKPYLCNVAKEQDVQRTFADIFNDFGAIHVLVNNAGITRDGLMLKYKEGQLVSKMSLEQWQMVIDVNLTGPFLCAREAAHYMITGENGGCVINISSISRDGNLGQSNYSAAKAGLASMTVVWAKEWARYGIRSMAIAPGFIATDMTAGMKPDVLEKMTKTIPAGRMGATSEIALTVQFIIENDYLTGRVIEVDGGLRL